MTKILILAANPNDTTRLRLDQEVRDIQEGLARSRNREEFQIISKSAVRPRDIQRALLDESPQIVHFSGHGEGEEGLVFQDELGNAKLVKSQALASLFSLFSTDIECILLNGCYSKVQAESIVEHIDYVIGMRKAISDVAAIEFAVSFYDALGAGKSYDFAYKLACNAIELNANTSQETPSRKLIPLDQPVETMGEHLTPILLKREDISEDNQRLLDQQTEDKDCDNDLNATLDANAVMLAGQERIAAIDAGLAEGERKFRKNLDQDIEGGLDWIKKNRLDIIYQSFLHTSSRIPDIFQNLSDEEQEDFQDDIENYLDSVYYSILTDSLDLLDMPIVRQSAVALESYRTAFNFIKAEIPHRFEQTQKMVAQRFDHLLQRIF